VARVRRHAPCRQRARPARILWRDWVKIIKAFFRTLVKRRADDPTERLAWLIIVASIPAGILGIAFEHTFARSPQSRLPRRSR